MQHCKDWSKNLENQYKNISTFDQIYPTRVELLFLFFFLNFTKGTEILYFWQ